jgi:hypothetical protein
MFVQARGVTTYLSDSRLAEHDQAKPIEYLQLDRRGRQLHDAV